MSLLIGDSNIFIDMVSGGLLEHMFQLPEEFAVPDVLYIEELSERHSELPAYGLRVLDMDSSVISEAVRLRTQYHKPSQNDLFALALASRRDCPIVTGDKYLREAAEAEGVTLVGTLWLIERMIEEGIVSVDAAEAAYDRMRSDGRRLPWPEVGRQLARLRKSK